MAVKRLRHCGVGTSKLCLWIILHGDCVCVCVYALVCVRVRRSPYSRDVRFNCSLPSFPTLAYLLSWH